MVNKRELGLAGEREAERYLISLGYRLLASNWRCRSGEIDLIMCDADVLVFVEVRTRTSDHRFGTAVESVQARKQQQVRTIAQYYLLRQRAGDIPIRFDVVTVLLPRDGGAAVVEHWKNAF